MADFIKKNVSMRDWKQRVQARLRYGEFDQKALVAVGEKGCGKSEITVQACKEIGLTPVICPGLGAQMVEDFLSMPGLEKGEDGKHRIVQAVHENLVPTEECKAKNTITVDGKKRVVIPWLIDEIFTFTNDGQANQLRGFLTFRQAGSVKIPYETIILGTTNPLSTKYSTRQHVDAAILDRIEFQNVKMENNEHDDWLLGRALEGKYPDVCRLFLKQPEVEGVREKASPRFWTDIFGGTWQELNRAKELSDDVRKNLFEQALMNNLNNPDIRSYEDGTVMKAESLIAMFFRYIKHGTENFPIAGISVVRAGDNRKEQQKQMARLMKWKKAQKMALVNISILDLIATLLKLFYGKDEEKKAMLDGEAVWEHIGNVVKVGHSDVLNQATQMLTDEGGVTGVPDADLCEKLLNCFPREFNDKFYAEMARYSDIGTDLSKG